MNGFEFILIVSVGIINAVACYSDQRFLMSGIATIMILCAHVICNTIRDNKP